MVAKADVLRTVDQDARRLAQELIRATPVAALATLGVGGAPFCSLTSVGTDVDGAPVLLVSRLSGHTTNLLADPRCSLLLARGGKGDPIAHPRITVMGAAGIVERDTEAARRLRRRFLARQPKAELYVDFPDFLFVRIAMASASLNGGFGKAFELTSADLTSATADAAALIEAEGGIIEHMNSDHAEAVGLYATRLAGRPAGRWRMVGCDPDGFEIANGGELARIAFPVRVTTPDQARAALVALAKAARAA